MSIWHRSLSLEFLNQRGQNTLVSVLDIVFVEYGEDFLTAQMPVNDKTRQPLGILHGGANVVLAETVASTAANCVINIDTHYCVGMEINANHLRPVKSGFVRAKSQPIHLGRTSQVWEIQVFNADNKLSCISRMTAAVVPR